MGGEWAASGNQMRMYVNVWELHKVEDISRKGAKAQSPQRNVNMGRSSSGVWERFCVAISLFFCFAVFVNLVFAEIRLFSRRMRAKRYIGIA
jgi:hypothetical protein